MQEIIARAKADKQRIVLPEGTEERTLKAADQLLADGVADIILIGNPAEIKELAAGFGLNHIGEATLVDPKNHEKKAAYADLLFQLRQKKGMTPEKAAVLVEDPLFLACLMIKSGDADGEIAGAENTTGNVLRPALQIIKTAPGMKPAVEIDLDEGMDKVRAILTKYPIKTRLNLRGTLIVARDIAHARIKQMLDEGKPMPDYFKKHPVYYAGPAKTPEGMASGSFGPTTAGRMDPYVDLFQSLGGSLVMVAKGNRTQQVTDACKKYGGFYLGSIGGPAAILAKNSIKSVEVVDFPELGMEAVRKIYVEDFPAFIIVDDKGNDFFADFKH